MAQTAGLQDVRMLQDRQDLEQQKQALKQQMQLLLKEEELIITAQSSAALKGAEVEGPSMLQRPFESYSLQLLQDREKMLEEASAPEVSKAELGFVVQVGDGANEKRDETAKPLLQSRSYNLQIPHEPLLAIQ